jgi:hypothetical protein
LDHWLANELFAAVRRSVANIISVRALIRFARVLNQVESRRALAFERYSLWNLCPKSLVKDTIYGIDKIRHSFCWFEILKILDILSNAVSMHDRFWLFGQSRLWT